MNHFGWQELMGSYGVSDRTTARLFPSDKA